MLRTGSHFVHDDEEYEWVNGIHYVVVLPFSIHRTCICLQLKIYNWI